jgi:hypothetical protein
MGELINLKRVRKAAQHAAKKQVAETNRVVHGTPKHLRKAGRAEKQRGDQKIEAHKLDPDERR